MFEVQISRNVKKFLKKLPESRHRRCMEALKRLKEDPFRNRPKCDVKKLSSREEAHRLQVGNYRFIYVVDSGTVIVEKAFKREKGY